MPAIYPSQRSWVMATVARRNLPHRVESPYVNSLFICCQEYSKVHWWGPGELCPVHSSPSSPTRHPEPSTRCFTPLPCSAREAKDLLRGSSGQPIIQAVSDNPMAQPEPILRLRETVSKHLAVCVARLRTARRGVRCIAKPRRV